LQTEKRGQSIIMTVQNMQDRGWGAGFSDHPVTGNRSKVGKCNGMSYLIALPNYNG